MRKLYTVKTSLSFFLFFLLRLHLCFSPTFTLNLYAVSPPLLSLKGAVYLSAIANDYQTLRRETWFRDSLPGRTTIWKYSFLRFSPQCTQQSLVTAFPLGPIQRNYGSLKVVTQLDKTRTVMNNPNCWWFSCSHCLQKGRGTCGPCKMKAYLTKFKKWMKCKCDNVLWSIVSIHNTHSTSLKETLKYSDKQVSKLVSFVSQSWILFHGHSKGWVTIWWHGKMFTFVCSLYFLDCNLESNEYFFCRDIWIIWQNMPS